MAPGDRQGPMRGRFGAGAGIDPARLGLVEESIVVGALSRRYYIARPANRGAAAIVVLHGGGGRAPGMAALCGIVPRAREMGVLTVFPEGVNRVWNDSRSAPRVAARQGVDDVGFLQALVARMTGDGSVDPGRVYFAGISNGSFMSEHLARHALVPIAGLALVAGPSTVPSNQLGPPQRPCPVLMFSGTADPLVPYDGGPITLMRGNRGGQAQRDDGGRAVRRAMRGRGPAASGRGQCVAAEVVAQQWAQANGDGSQPVVEGLPTTYGDLPVTRLTWSAPGRPWVSLHRIEGGGHTWPGGPQYLPQHIVGAVSHLDATGIILQAFGGS
jgi:polyhydroxybutyrate depolymerase